MTWYDAEKRRGGNDIQTSLWRLLLALLLLAALFLVPSVVLMGGEWLPELLETAPYARWWRHLSGC